MPYIPKKDRIKYERTLESLVPITNKGELEFCIFKLMKLYMWDKEVRYSTLHDTAYAAIHCGDEFRRRFLDPREDEVKLTNGDIE
jgi:hypothetical protein